MGRVMATVWLAAVVAVTFPLGYGLGVLLLGATAPFDPQRRLVHRFLSAWCAQWLRCWPFWRTRVVGRRRIPSGPCVLVANHQSMADFVAVMGLGTSFKFVAKASLFSFPFLGWIMRQMKYVALERGRLKSAEAMLKACGELLDAGDKVLIFPEGTYATGARRLPFRRGAFHLAQLKQVPLVPVVLRGTAELVFEDGPWFSFSSDIEVEVMEPLAPPAPGADVSEWVKAVEARYAGWLGRSTPERTS
jgi:1-acyl-sn-glycerol-3-phosphate acyltransferase